MLTPPWICCSDGCVGGLHKGQRTGWMDWAHRRLSCPLQTVPGQLAAQAMASQGSPDFQQTNIFVDS